MTIIFVNNAWMLDNLVVEIYDGHLPVLLQ